MQFRDGALRAELVLKNIRQRGALTLNQLWETPEIKAVTKQKYALNGTLSYARSKKQIFRSPGTGKDRWVYDVVPNTGGVGLEMPAVLTSARTKRPHNKKAKPVVREVSRTNLVEAAQSLPPAASVVSTALSKPNISVYDSMMVIETDKIRIEINYG